MQRSSALRSSRQATLVQDRRPVSARPSGQPGHGYRVNLSSPVGRDTCMRSPTAGPSSLLRIPAAAGRVHLHHDTVDLVVEIVAFRFHFGDERSQFLKICTQRPVRVHMKTVLFEPFEIFPVRSEHLLVSAENVIREHIQPPRRDDRRIQHSQRSRSTVSRIRKRFLALHFQFSIDLWNLRSR